MKLHEMWRVGITGAAVQVLRPCSDEPGCRAGLSRGALVKLPPSNSRFRLVFTDVWWFKNQSHEVTDRLVHELRAQMDFAVVAWYVNRPSTLRDDVETSDGMTPLVANERFGHLEPAFVGYRAGLRCSQRDASYP